MNFMKKGPELKMPDKMPNLKVPGFLSDIYHELRERHLLPLVVVLLVAIVAVPIALSESAETKAPAPEDSQASASASASQTSQVVVAKNEPGLRDYRKRLGHLTSTNPFKQHYTTAPTTSTGGGEESSANETPPVDTTERDESGNAPAETSPGNPNITYYSFAMDVRVTPVSSHGKPSKAQPEVRNNLPELTQLPSRQTPAIIFMGVTKDSKKALMLVSSNVKAIFGDNVCAAGGETCELLAMEPGVPENFVYGGNEKIYRIELIDLNLVRSDSVNKAPLGKPHKQNSSHSG
jgi:hypothetical protein